MPFCSESTVSCLQSASNGSKTGLFAAAVNFSEVAEQLLSHVPLPTIFPRPVLEDEEDFEDAAIQHDLEGSLSLYRILPLLSMTQTVSSLLSI